MEKIIINNDLLFGNVCEVLRSGRTAIIPVKGVSMLPLIKGERDSVVLEPLAPGSLAEGRRPQSGDIVLFHLGGRYILHRVISIKDGIATIQGDGVAKGQEICPVEKIYGRVVSIRKNGKKEIDPNTPAMLFLARLWQKVPMRRYVLAVYKRLPWNLWILRGQRNTVNKE